MTRRQPPRSVLASFGLEGEAIPLEGGRGSSWRVGRAALKPADMDAEQLAWQADLVEAIQPNGFRIAPFLRATDGSLVVEGWSATAFEEGRHEQRWAEIVTVGDRFHQAVVRVARPDFLNRRRDSWATGDRVAWEELPFAAEGDPLLQRLLAARHPIGARSQLIHGDLTENVLFSDDLPPAIIDLAPYWRPPAFASAVVVADALVWHGADASVLDGVSDIDQFAQFLVRALIYRIVTHRLFRPGEPVPPVAMDPHREAVELADRLAGAGR